MRNTGTRVRARAGNPAEPREGPCCYAGLRSGVGGTRPNACSRANVNIRANVRGRQRRNSPVQGRAKHVRAVRWARARAAKPAADARVDREPPRSLQHKRAVLHRTPLALLVPAPLLADPQAVQHHRVLRHVGELRGPQVDLDLLGASGQAPPGAPGTNRMRSAVLCGRSSREVSSGALTHPRTHARTPHPREPGTAALRRRGQRRDDVRPLRT